MTCRRIIRQLGIALGSVTILGGCAVAPTQPANGYVLPDKVLQTATRLAESGDGEACFQLHQHYTLGLGEYREGERWLRTAAESGSPRGMYGYGVGLWNVAQTAPEKAAARKWITKAAVAGNDAAKAFLSRH